jgi:hypothetical protein
MKHETKWNASKFTEAAMQSDSVAAFGEKLSLGGGETRRFAELGGTVETSIPEEWEQGSSAQTGDGPAFAADGFSKNEIEEAAGKRASSGRLFHGLVDAEAPRGIDKERVRHPVLHRESLEIDDSVRVELPEAGKTGQREKRGCDSSLEAVSVAPYKKTLNGSARIWSSSMKADFCWFQALQEHGRPGDIHPRLMSLENGARFLPYPQSVFPRKENDWLSISNFILIKTSAPDNLSTFSDISCGIFKNRYSFCGTEAGCINQNWFNNSWIVIRESTRTASRVMPRNSIPMNLSGRNLKKQRTTAFPITYCNSGNCSTIHCENYGVPRDCCGLAS